MALLKNVLWKLDDQYPNYDVCYQLKEHRKVIFFDIHSSESNQIFLKNHLFISLKSWITFHLVYTTMQQCIAKGTEIFSCKSLPFHTKEVYV